MLLKLQSKPFIFESGEALAMPWNLAAEGGMEAWIDRTNVGRFSPVTLNGIELPGVSRAGEFQLVTGGLSVRRLSDGLSFPNVMFSTQFDITGEDLKNGYAELLIDAASVFKVTVLDRGLQPIPHRRLTLIPDSARNKASTSDSIRILSMGATSDENGTFYFLGNNPCLLRVQLDAETGATIVPV